MIRMDFKDIPIGTLFYYLGAPFVKDHTRVLYNRKTNAYVPNTPRRVYFAPTINVAVERIDTADEWEAA